MAQLAYRPALIYIDSPKYLVTSDGAEPEGYRLMLKPLERLGGLGLVTIWQHLLGLAMGVALYVLLIRRGAPRWAAVLAAAPILLDAYQLQLEQTIMPDCLFEALVVAGLVLLAWRAGPPWRLVVAAAVAMGAAVDVREIGLVLIVPVVVFVFLTGRGWRVRFGHAVLAMAAFVVPVLSYMTMAYGMGGHFALVSYPQPLTYGRTAIAANCATLKVSSVERKLCPSTTVVKSLNQGIDSLLHNPRLSRLGHVKLPPSMTQNQLAHDFADQVIKQQPLRVTASVARDAVRLFALTRDGNRMITDITRFQFQTSYPVFPPTTSRHYVTRLAHAKPVVVKPLAKVLRAYQLHGGYTPGPVFAAGTITGLLVSLMALGRWLAGLGRRLPAGQVDPGLGAACLLFTLTGVAVLLASDFYEFTWRYQMPALFTLPLAGVLGWLAVAKARSAARAPVSPAPVAQRAGVPAA